MQHLSQFLQLGYSVFRQYAILVRRTIENECSIASYCFQIHLEQAGSTLHGFTLMPEPALVGCFRIAFTWMPEPAVDVAILAYTTATIVCHGPVGITSISRFVTNPACFTTYAPQHTVRSNAMNMRTEVRGIVINISVYLTDTAFTTIVSIATIGTVEPHFELVATIFGQFFTLLQEHLCYISILAIMCRVSIPRRNVETIFHAMLLTSLSI